MLLRYVRWSSAGILLKLCFHSFLCLLVCLIFQVRVEKWMFLKIQLSVFAKTNVTLDGTEELTRRLTVLFSPLRSCMRPYYYSPSIDSSGRSWLCTCSECKLQELLELQTPILPFTSDHQFQICLRPLQWGTIVQWKVHPPKGRYHAGHRHVEMDCSCFLASKSAGKHYQWHWKENWIWQACSFLFFSVCLPNLALKGKSSAPCE